MLLLNNTDDAGWDSCSVFFCDSASFKLKFRTSANNGILYYAEGLYHPTRVFDYEGLFLYDGYLHYFLFNPAPYSIGSTFGFNGKSKQRLNDGKWHQVCQSSSAKDLQKRNTQLCLEQYIFKQATCVG